MEIPLSFFIGVAVALAIVLCITFVIDRGNRFSSTLVFVSGFAIGMLTLYIKVRLLGL